MAILRKPDIAYIPCTREIVEEILDFAGIESGDVIYDLGCGDGRILTAAAKRYGTRGVGIDIDSERVRESRINAIKYGLDKHLKFIENDLFVSDFSEASIVFIYLLPHLNLKLRPLLWEQLKPGTKIISRDFDMGDWKPLKKLFVTDPVEEEEANLFYWEI